MTLAFIIIGVTAGIAAGTLKYYLWLMQRYEDW